jgi:hypothetical protein
MFLALGCVSVVPIKPIKLHFENAICKMLFVCTKVNQRPPQNGGRLF